ncbi:MAG: hypothetical protein KDJ36_15050, partial [Hyphomicrobiaceae bacterium]|nr:hypothetical protein [Hyphomicrobiaceae bacterium]
LSSLANIAFTAYLGFAPGQGSPNQYGSPKGNRNAGAPAGGSPAGGASGAGPQTPAAPAAWEASADSAIAAALERYTSQASTTEARSNERRNRAAPSGFGRRRPA